MSARLGIVGYCAPTGVGRMCVDLARQLRAAKQLVPSHALNDARLAAASETIFCAGRSPTESELREFLTGLDAVVTVESTYRSPLTRCAREMGVRSVMIPMWEWWPPPAPAHFDLYLHITHHSFVTIPDSPKILLPYPVALDEFQPRRIAGPGRTFLHCAGRGGRNQRKGTEEAVRGFLHAAVPGCTLIVRSQVDSSFWGDEIRGYLEGRSDIRFVRETAPHPNELYAEGDFYLFTSRYEGHALVPLEAMACGLPTAVTDAAPMNEYPGAWRIGVSEPRLFRTAADIVARPCSVASVAQVVRRASETDLAAHSDHALAVARDYSWDALRARWLEALG